MQPRVHFLLPVADAPVRLGTCVYVDSVVLAATRYTLSQNFTVSRYHWLAHDCVTIFVRVHMCVWPTPVSVTLTWFETYRLCMPKIYHGLSVLRRKSAYDSFTQEEKSRWEGKKRRVNMVVFFFPFRRKLTRGTRKWEFVTMGNKIIRNFRL